MKQTQLIKLLFILATQISFGQIPHLTGNVKVSILNGTIESDLEYSNLPKLKNYSIWLNSGLNLRHFRDKEDNFNYSKKKFYNKEKSYEATQYYILDSIKNQRFLPQNFKIKYEGKFPVIFDTLKAKDFGDWKGNMAFNGKSLRATEQSAWYPILYDIENDIAINKVTYDITINCEDCNGIYLNGSDPKKGTSVNFKSNQPIALMLFAGLFDFTKNNNTYFVNTSLNVEQEKVLANWTDKIIQFYEEKLKIPYGNPVTYIYTTPVSKKNAWMFVTYPSITIIGQEKYNVKSYFMPNSSLLKDTSNIEYFAHELGHYYFGTYFVPNSDLQWMFLEGVTEYLALQTVKEVLGEDNYNNKINSYLTKTKNYKPKPLSTLKNREIDEIYRYYYTPLLLTVLEKEIGKEKIWNWLQTILKSDKKTKTDYTFFKNSLLKCGVSETDFNSFEDKYIVSKNAKENVLESIKK